MTHHTDSDPTPPHGIERPETWDDRDKFGYRNRYKSEAIDAARARREAEWQWPDRRPTHTWTDVTRLVTRLDSAAVAAGHPATWGSLHLVTPEAPGDHARIERRGSSDRIPGGSILGADATSSHAMLTTRLDLYRDLADAGSESARIYLLNRDQK